jgi:hypothetical protein
VYHHVRSHLWELLLQTRHCELDDEREVRRNGVVCGAHIALSLTVCEDTCLGDTLEQLKLGRWLDIFFWLSMPDDGKTARPISNDE